MNTILYHRKKPILSIHLQTTISFLFENVVRYIKIDDNSGRILSTEQSILTAEQKEILAALSISEEKFWNFKINHYGLKDP